MPLEKKSPDDIREATDVLGERWILPLFFGHVATLLLSKQILFDTQCLPSKKRRTAKHKVLQNHPRKWPLHVCVKQVLFVKHCPSWEKFPQAIDWPKNPNFKLHFLPQLFGLKDKTVEDSDPPDKKLRGLKNTPKTKGSFMFFLTKKKTTPPNTSQKTRNLLFETVPMLCALWNSRWRTGGGTFRKTECGLDWMRGKQSVANIYPVILRILGFWTAPHLGK